jgi:peroxiredoxin
MEKITETPNYNNEKIQLQENLAAMLTKESLSVFSEDAKQLAVDHPTPLKVAVGEKAPTFELPNAVGNSIALLNQVSEGPVVLTFYRGNWCPYCNLVLNTYQKILPEIKALGGSLIAISPQKPDSTLDMKEKNELEFEVLSDIGNTVAKQYTTIIKNSLEAIQEAKNLGIDFYDFYEDASRDIPVPAVFIIDQQGTIVFAKSEGGDYSLRVEPQDILTALKKLK